MNLDEPALSSRKILRLFQIASELAARSDGAHKHGCVIVKGGAVLARSYNTYFNGQHAEKSAIGCQWASELKGATLVVVRLRKDRKFGLSKPCPECEKHIRNCGIKKVFYSTNDINNPIAQEVF